MNQIAILYPVFVQALLALVVGDLMAVARARAIANMDRSAAIPIWRSAGSSGRRMRPSVPPTTPISLSCRCLFYAVAAFALIAKGADLLMVVLAWLFVLTRLVHAAIHIGPNKVRWRSPAFALGFLIVPSCGSSCSCML